MEIFVFLPTRVAPRPRGDPGFSHFQTATCLRFGECLRPARVPFALGALILRSHTDQVDGHSVNGSLWQLLRPRGLSALVLSAVLAIGGSLTALLSRTVHQAEQQEARTALANDARDIATAIEAHLLAHEGLLRAGVGLIDTFSIVSRDEWRTFAAQMRLSSTYPGIHGIGVAVLLRGAADEARWTQVLARPLHRFPDAPDEALQSAIVLLEPDDARNRQALGLDMMSEPIRRQAMLRARDLGLPVLTSQVTLLQELTDAHPQPGFLLYAPIYSSLGGADTLTARREKHLGFVYSAFRAGDFFSHILKVSPGRVRFAVHDDVSRGQHLLYRNTPAPSAEVPTAERAITFAQRTWRLQVWPGADTVSASAGRWVGIAGTAVTLLLGVSFLLLLGSREHLRLRMQQAETLAESDRAHALMLERRVAERTQALQEAVSELSVANRELEAFSYSVSHDLRAPLRSVGAHLEILLMHSGPLCDQQTHHANCIRDSVRRMAQMIEGLLRLAIIARQPLDRRHVELGNLIAAVLDDVQRDYPGRIEVNLHGLGLVNADATLLQQVLGNLLANATKFSRHVREPKVSVEAYEAAGERVFQVRDNGTGFDMCYAAKLFGVFERLHSTRDFEGTGIGLALAKKIIERHGGRIWAQAAAGEGATFFFTLGADSAVDSATTLPRAA